MCGIAVILEGSAVAVPPFAIDRVTNALRHRGPDAQDCVRRDGCQLGHTRLSIIDPVGGQQPMCDASGRYWIVFNGEIYNFRELRTELENRGSIFTTSSDTEVLLHAYLEWGAAVPRRLNGQFAFAIWDDVEHTVFVARDRFGEKPLFWARSHAGHVLIASEIKSILASDMISPQIDRASADAYVSLFYVPPDRTIYENVHALPPAHAALWKDGRVRQWRYWEPQLSCHRIIALDDAVDEIRRLLAQAVKRQMVADVPVGAFLSGGLDSSTIVALMSAETSQPVQTFAAGFGDLINELPFAREVAQQYATDHHELQMDIDVAAMLDRMMDVYDEPFADSSNIPTYLIAEHARRNVKVALSGDGGDEIFGGYAWYEPLLETDATDDVWDRHLGAASGKSILRRTYRPVDAALTGIDRAAYFDLHCYLPGDILVKVDRAAMAHGLETRAPFLDVNLVEFVLGLPQQMRFDGVTQKNLLRRACGHLWPESIRSRAKQGFGAPVRSWIEQPAVADLWKKAIARNGALAALFPELLAKVSELRPQRRWTLLCLGLWLERRPACLANLSLAS